MTSFFDKVVELPAYMHAMEAGTYKIPPLMRVL
jgi:hypothetical protein